MPKGSSLSNRRPSTVSNVPPIFKCPVGRVYRSQRQGSGFLFCEDVYGREVLRIKVHETAPLQWHGAASDEDIRLVVEGIRLVRGRPRVEDRQLTVTGTDNKLTFDGQDLSHEKASETTTTSVR